MSSSSSYGDAMKNKREVPSSLPPNQQNRPTNNNYHQRQQQSHTQSWGPPDRRSRSDHPPSRTRSSPGPHSSAWGGRGGSQEEYRPQHSRRHQQQPQQYDRSRDQQPNGQKSYRENDQQRWNLPHQPQQQGRHQEYPNPAWGDSRASTAHRGSVTTTPHPNTQPSTQRAIPSSSTWGRLTPSAHPAAEPVVSVSATGVAAPHKSVWTNISNQRQTPQPNQPRAINTTSQNLTTAESTPKKQGQPPKVQLLKKNSSSGLPQQQQSTNTATGKTSKNSKPKLKTMCISDMLADPKITKGSGSKKSKLQHQSSKQQTKTQPSIKVDSVQEFPALGAAPVTMPSTGAPKPAWGVKQKSQQPIQTQLPLTLAVSTASSKNLASGWNDENPRKRNKIKGKANNQPDPLEKGGESSLFRPLNHSSTRPQIQQAEERQLDGEEYQLLRLMQKGNVYEKKGRHRVMPRKKKFTALKKKVLQERLDKWQAMNPEESATMTTNQAVAVSSSTVCIYHYTTLEEVEDDDEYEEILENLKTMATRVGPFEEVFIPRRVPEGEEADDDGIPVFVKFEKVSHAAAAQACWNDLSVGGSKLRVAIIDVGISDDDKPWSEKVLLAESNLRHAPCEPAECATSIDIFLQKVLTVDDYEDDECMEESLQDLKKIAAEFGQLEQIQASDKQDGNVILTYICDIAEARTIADSLCRSVVGGKPIYAFVKEEAPKQSGRAGSTILLDNILTEDDLEDEQCLVESLGDIKELCARYGKVWNVVAEGRGVKITYEGDIFVGETAAKELDGMILGGNVIAASVVSSDWHHVTLQNVLTEDDLDDEDCLQESMRDIRELAAKYGEIESVEILRADETASVRIQYKGDPSIAESAATALNGILIGGQACSAIYGGRDQSPTCTLNDLGELLGDEVSGDKRKPPLLSGSDKKARTDEKEPLYSGDKLISERFAEMKRVPKVPNAPGPREYATGNDERVKPLLIEMLGELMRLQKRAIDDKNAKARRRIVMGLREVARGIKAKKVKMVVMANNLDQYGVIDEKLQEIIDLAKEHDVPIFFEFSKRTLGKALGKSIKIAVVGIQSADGAYQPFKKLNAIGASRIEY
ncbi:ribosomal protein L7Ae/L30e/S12e/Gadd45 family protein [Nitzschia inconspicua]|uniref:Ribosomal protein L7Ae/L30e/S12e/Gadd45 family protein n=2 Tax=Nitzschia inconspicua TaxID=303405 RepID=A0A9K3LFK3_9STRA|nr:ribosomal protein L7Ae/L30e/S12e/Gadd45 family protein [Nitzschia inconspicua]